MKIDLRARVSVTINLDGDDERYRDVQATDSTDPTSKGRPYLANHLMITTSYQDHDVVQVLVRGRAIKIGGEVGVAERGDSLYLRDYVERGSVPAHVREAAAAAGARVLRLEALERELQAELSELQP